MYTIKVPSRFECTASLCTSCLAMLCTTAILTISSVTLGYVVSTKSTSDTTSTTATEYDVSGSGMCTQTERFVSIDQYQDTHFVWAQSPRSVEKTRLLQDFDFTGKNGILMKGSRHQLLTVISTPNGVDPFDVKVDGSVTEMNGYCTFTLDPEPDSNAS